MFEQICSSVAKSGPFYLITALCHVSWTYNWLSDVRQADFLCRDDAFHSWFLSLSFSLYEYTDMFQGNNEAKINLPTSTVKVSVKACSLHIHHYPCYWLEIHLLWSLIPDYFHSHFSKALCSCMVDEEKPLLVSRSDQAHSDVLIDESESC